MKKEVIVCDQCMAERRKDDYTKKRYELRIGEKTVIPQIIHHMDDTVIRSPMGFAVDALDWEELDFCSVECLKVFVEGLEGAEA